MNTETDNFIEAYCTETISGMGLLYKEHLFGQFLILLYASIDTMGLLNAPSTQTSATGASFQAWVTKYLLPEPNIAFTAIDLWGARCSILHTFTSESDLSRNGRAKELQYYTGPKESAQMVKLVNEITALNNGSHIPVSIDDTYTAYMNGVIKFATDLSAECASNSDSETRVRNLIQRHRV